ncbi:helix-turn-helix transcriptional regulator [Nocardiopsis sp. NPDC006938]|uniref:helix-turn-helix transcriptional regulator n=1 Tax=Nocardiopsis sp. NPDC006938 TaxID=3364337 RepID=UPI0036931129
MELATPLANGLRTDHPIPGLPFVDDSHLPLTDPEAIEDIGRNTAQGMWGRCDEQDEGWLAFTTDAYRHDLGWAVRYHPDHGRTVLLYTDSDAAGVHTDWWNDTLLWREGGYWWDGTTWFRPAMLWDPAREDYQRHPVPAALTVTAADMLDGTGDPGQATVRKISTLTQDDTTAPGRWLNHLALWAQHRPHDALPLEQCVVTLTAPELKASELLSVTDMAQLAGIAPSTLRGYISRDEADVPAPQEISGGRSAWSRPVAQAWVELRHRSPESVAEALADRTSDQRLNIGEALVKKRFAKSFFSYLWEHPTRRKIWALRHRNEETVRQTADALAWEVSKSLDQIIPTDALSATIRHAILDELGRSQELRSRNGGTEIVSSHGITVPVAKMLDWLVRHHPTRAQHTIDQILGDAQRRLDIPQDVTTRSLRTALSLDSEMDEDVRNEFLDRVLPRPKR